MTRGNGSYVLPQRVTVGGDNLNDSIQSEIQKFVADYNRAATGSVAEATNASQGAVIKVVHNPGLKTLGKEGYLLSVTATGITLESPTPKGVFYGFTSIKKLLPACIMAGVKDSNVTEYALPIVNITDSPRFPYRGFMLDVSRHFFDIKQVKRMIDVMAAYKMNTFHFHLTDDQGWRWEVKKYPNLTRIGSIASNTYITSMYHGAYHTNAQYGPFFYTQDELRELVAYAAERHIEIIPEIDMPGHFVAAMASYPEFSCWPDGHHAVWTSGGISNDVLNVANPQAVQFAKDILDELMEIFPSKTIHIGGDECPTTAWEGNALCQARYRELGLTSYRQLQSHFIKEMDEHVKAKGRKLAVWNEAITAGGTDLNIMKNTGATVFCWTGPEAAAAKAANMKLQHVYTPWGPYYINRQSSNAPWEQSFPGDGSDHLQTTYNVSPPQNAYTIGVQATFWTEHVGTNDVLEYLALPRLMAIAEAGWTPQTLKNFSNFQQRMCADTTMLNYNGYQFGRNFLNPPTTTPEADQTPPAIVPEVGGVYLIRCAAEGFSQTAMADNGKSANPIHTTDARANIGWTVTQATNYDATSRTLTLSLKNTATNRAIGMPASSKTGTLGFPVAMGQAATLTLAYHPAHKDFTLAAGGKNLYPVPHTSTTLPGIISAGNDQGLGNATRPQGAVWKFVPARAISYLCKDTEGNTLGTVKEFIEKTATTLTAPTFAGYILKTALPTLTPEAGNQDLELTYERTHNLVFLSCEDERGGILQRDTIAIPLGQSQRIAAPAIPHYAVRDIPAEGIEQTPTSNIRLTFVYTTDAFTGVERVAEPITTLTDGQSVLIFDTSINAPDRAGYRNVAPTSLQVMQGSLLFGTATPYFTWTMEKSGARWKVRNEITEKYMPEMVQSGKIIVSHTAGLFRFTLNSDKETWKVQGSNGQFWDGVVGSMTGWHTYGHPYRLHRYFAAPYFGVTLTAYDENHTLLEEKFSVVRAGEGYSLILPIIKDKALRSIETSAEDLKSITAHTTIRCTYGSVIAGLHRSPTNASQSGIYDLQGRRVAASHPGLYIINGKKVVLR